MFEQTKTKVAVKEAEQVLNLPVLNYREQLKKCFERKDELFYDLCKLCYEIKKYKIWEKEGYASISEYIKEFEEKYEFSTSTFYAFAKMGEFIDRYGFTVEEIKSFGFSKFREYVYFCEANELSEESMRKLFTVGMQLSLREFREKLNEVSESLGKELNKTKKVKEDKDSEIDKKAVEVLKQYDSYEEGDYEEVQDILEEELDKDTHLKDYVRSILKQEEDEKVTINREKEKEGILKTFESYISSTQKTSQTIILTYSQEVYDDILKPAFELVKRKTGIENINEIVLYIIYSFLQEHLDEIKLLKELEKNFE